VNQSPLGDYGYAVTDYFALNPRYGTEADFRQLVQEAHQRKMRVLMDFVPNHSSDQHPYFKAALQYGTASHHWDFYDRDAAGNPTHYYDWTNLPNLNYSNPEVEQWMLAAASYWVREFDVDGFRVDVAGRVKERKPDFWLRWRRTLKRIKPDLLLLAEASARDPYYFDNGFDAAYDWTSQPGHWAWELVFADEKLVTYNLNTALNNGRRGFHPDALIFRFLNNNDSGARFITRHGPAMTKVATALLFTLPGIPCLFTGDEVGEAFSPYFDPQPLTWKEQIPGWRDYHKQLIALRKTTPSLRSRLWQPVTVEPHQQVYGYVRYGEPSAPPVLVLLNFAEETVEAEIQLPAEFPALFEDPLRDLLSAELVTAQKANSVRIVLPALGTRILAPNPA
jgi:glycosidase